jgi:polysaccharide export outer membrane protein
MRRSITVFCLLVMVALAGCAGQRYRTDLYALEPEPYRVGSGDRLRIIVYGQDSLSNSYSVDATGQISMPLIGFVSVNGLTTREVEHVVDSKLRAGFLRDPKISAEVEAYRPFFILGEVTTAGQYPYVNGMTVQNAVAIAGGFTPRGYQGAATLTRVIDGQAITGDVPIIAPVRPGDTIVIRERFF